MEEKKTVTFNGVIAVKEIREDMHRILAKGVNSMYSDLIDIAEKIHVTRAFKRGFISPNEIRSLHWRIRNTTDHAEVLAQGRHSVNGKAYGSLGWYNGLAPMLRKLEADVVKEFDKVQK